MRVGDPEAESQLRIWRVAAFIQCGDLRAAAADVEAFARLSERMGQPRWEWYAPLLRGLLALVEGRMEDAERLRTEAGELGLPVHGSMAPLLLGAMLVATRWTERALGDLVEPVTALADAHPSQPAWRCVRVAALVDAGRVAEARAEIEGLVGPYGLRLRMDTTWLASTALLADAVARIGDAATAGILREALLPHASHNAMLPSGAFLGPVRLHLGALSTAIGEPGAALEHLALARELADRGGMRAMAAWIALDEADALVTRHGEGDLALRARGAGARSGSRRRARPVARGRPRQGRPGLAARRRPAARPRGCARRPHRRSAAPRRRHVDRRRGRAQRVRAPQQGPRAARRAP